MVDVFFTRSGDSGGVANRTVDTMTGDASDTTLSLSQSPGSENNVSITFDGVMQHHDTFSLSGSTITFSTAPPTGVKVEAVSGGLESIGTPSDGTVTLAKMAVNSIDSDQYVDGSIDTAHIATNQIDETLMKDAFVGDFTDATVTASDYFLHGDATDSGNTKKDTVQGILDLAGGGLESSTVAVFFQSGAPTDWTKSTANNDKMLRVVSGTGGGTGGTAAVSSPAHSISAAAHTLAISAMPSHDHALDGWANNGSGGSYNWEQNLGETGTTEQTTDVTNTGGGGSHTHSGTGSITTPAYMDVIIATKD